MPKIPVTFNLGTQSPAKLGTAIVKPASKGKMSYSQNVEVQSDEAGNSVLVPGPALVTIGNNSNLTGVAAMAARFISSLGGVAYIYFAQGILGAKNVIRRLTQVSDGSTPIIDSGGSITVTHSGHSSIVVDDIVFREDSNSTMYIVGKDTNDQWVQSFLPGNASPSLSVVTTLTSSNSAYEHKIIKASDTYLYIGHREFIDAIDTSGTYSNNVLDIPKGQGVTALEEWNSFLAIAYSDNIPFTFAERKSAGQSGIYLWNFVDPSFEKAAVVCPSRYISVLIKDPSGQLLVFGGVDEGKTTIYEFTGYGYKEIYTYIGDMPRSRHNVDFDGQGRIVWITADGQICRLRKGETPEDGVFEHLGTITTDSSAGGLFTRLLGGSGNEFVTCSGAGSTYTMKRVTFGNYIGDGDAGSDGVTTPIAISGQVQLPPKSVVTGIEIGLNKETVSGDKLNGYLFKNGSTTPITMGTVSYANDGAVASKIIRNTQYSVDNAALGVAWKMTDNSNTAPGVIDGYIHYNEIKT